jgi:hypothetical protein
VSASRFDEEYYARFYGSAPVHTQARIGHLAMGVTGLFGWWGLRLRTVLDIGAGPGYWRDWFEQHRPRVMYRSVDASEYACERFGHECRDISTWRPGAPSDLVVCQGVLQYLTNPAATTAIEHLAAATRYLLYLEVPTLHDRDHVVDQEYTDMDCRWRSGLWYRRRLAPHFEPIGAGLWARNTAGLRFYELERMAR